MILNKIDKSDFENVSYYAYEKIKKSILCREIGFDRKISIKEISELLGISRTPIREALIMLTKDKIIERNEDGSFTIRQFSMKDVQDMYEFREIIEKKSIKPILENSNEKSIENLKNILSFSRKAIEQNNPSNAMLGDLEFHIKFIEIGNNATITEAITTCMERLTLIGRSIANLTDCIESNEEHEQIIDTLIYKNSEKLNLSVTDHIKKAKSRRFKILKNDIERLYIKS